MHGEKASLQIKSRRSTPLRALQDKDPLFKHALAKLVSLVNWL